MGVLMPLTLGLRYLNYTDYGVFHYAMTITWFIGGLLFGWGAVLYRSRSLGILGAVSLPVAVYLAQAAMFDSFGLSSAWHAFGLALLGPLYLWCGL